MRLTTDQAPTYPRLNVSTWVVKAYIVASAIAHGLNPRIVIAIVKSEGGYDVNAHGDVTQGGSYGPFQYNMLPGSRGDAFFKAHPLTDPRDPHNWMAVVDDAVNYISTHRNVRSIMGQWHGVNNDPHINGPDITSGVGTNQNVADFLAAVQAGWENVKDDPGGPPVDPPPTGDPPPTDPPPPVAGACGPIMSVTWGGPGNAVPVPVFDGAALMCEVTHTLEATGRELRANITSTAETLGREALEITLKVLLSVVAVALVILGVYILTNAASVLNGTETEG